MKTLSLIGFTLAVLASRFPLTAAEDHRDFGGELSKIMTDAAVANKDYKVYEEKLMELRKTTQDPNHHQMVAFALVDLFARDPGQYPIDIIRCGTSALSYSMDDVRACRTHVLLGDALLATRSTDDAPLEPITAHYVAALSIALKRLGDRKTIEVPIVHSFVPDRTRGGSNLEAFKKYQAATAQRGESIFLARLAEFRQELPGKIKGLYQDKKMMLAVVKASLPPSQASAVLAEL